MSYEQNLSGGWKLTGYPEGAYQAVTPAEIPSTALTIEAAVPGNIELDLHRAGIIPDPYVKLNAMTLQPYESWEWWLEREFDCSPGSRRIELVMEGVDTFATIRLNGQEVGQTDNAMIPHRFDVTPLLRDGSNHIAVRIAAPANAVRNRPISPLSFSAYAGNYESLWVRKPAHSWGWDITPRMALGGIFRPVYLRELPPVRITGTYLQTMSLEADQARLMFHYAFATPDASLQDYRLEVRGRCDDSEFVLDRQVRHTAGALKIAVDHPRLWWPRGYGKPHLYGVVCRIYRGDELLAEEKSTFGIRTVSLFTRPTATTAPDPDFQFIVNGERITVKGTNWVPADALHSRDPERIPAIIDLAVDLNCNMLRVWGGGIYEPHLFYDLCDRHGLMVWQDLMMGCARYPHHPDFLAIIERELRTIIPELRRHPSIVLWAGDNEIDLVHSWSGMNLDPNLNLITRRLVPEILQELDPLRPYLPSSPYVSSEAAAASRAAGKHLEALAPEQHLWGPRDYFKSDFYRCTTASFVSEIGYHGCPAVSSIKQFVSPEAWFPPSANREWDYHASNPWLDSDSSLNYRTELMSKQIREMFGVMPSNLEDFALASQICQAEAKKYFIELIRSRPKMSGLLWWNLIDCWPQFSDAIVDYYFRRKLAYYYIRRLQQPFCVVVGEPAVWNHPVILINDSLQKVSGSYKIWEHGSGRVLLEEDFILEPNRRKTTALPARGGEQRLLLISWRLDDGGSGCNHYLCGSPNFDLERYRREWLPALAALDETFNPEQTAQ